MLILNILYTVILPIFAILGIGVLLDRRFRFDLPTLGKLNFYVFVPALSFVKLLEAEVTIGQMMTIGVFSLVHLAILLALSWGLFALPRWRDRQHVLSMGVIFNNVGNYGIPLVALAFGSEMVGIVAILIVVQSLLVFTLGIWLFERSTRGAGAALAGMAKVPVVYAVVAALLLRGLHIQLPGPLYATMSYLADGLIPIALLTLGVQLARTRLDRDLFTLSAVSMMRLIISPALAALLVAPFGFTAPISSVLIVAAGFPVAVNLYILAAEYRQHEELASQSIFISTLLSAVTVAVLLFLVR